MPDPAIKDEKLCRGLRKQDDSKKKGARISNAAAARGRSSVDGQAASRAPTTTGPCHNSRNAPNSLEFPVIRA